MRLKLSHLLMVCIFGFLGLTRTAIAVQVGYIYCGKDQQESSVPVYFNACTKRQVGSFPCRHQIEVVAELGQLLKVRTSAGSIVFVDANVVSQKVDEFAPIAIEAESAPDCNVRTPQYDPKKNRGPHPVFQPEPDYPATAPRSRDEKTVGLTLVVGVDGRPRAIKVGSSPGRDFAKSAVEAVRKWKFEPALKDGQPIEMPISVEVRFRLIY
jgi:TonB family protein